MADDIKTGNISSQNNPVMEVVPIEEAEEVEKAPKSDKSKTIPLKFIPEEIPEETPEELTLTDIGGSGNGRDDDIPTIDESTFGKSSSMRKYVFVGMGIVGLVVLFIIIFTLILSFSKKKTETAATLEYWGLWEDEQVMKPLIDAYTREHPAITIKYIKQDPKDYREKLLTRGKEGRGPDIFRFHNTWLPSIIELAAPLPKSIMSDDTYKETFYDVIQDDVYSDGSYYGIALGIDGLVLVYNTDLFKRAGISSAPETWDDVLKAADALRVQDGANQILTSGIALGTANNIENFSDIFGWMLLQNGADIKNLRAREAVEVLTNYRQFAEPQLNLWNENMPNNISAFTQGKVGMIIVPTWQILEILTANPDIKLKVTSLPVLPGSQSISLATYWVEGVSKTSKNQEAAWNFLAYLSKKENMTKLYQEQTKVRPFGVAYSRKDLRETLIKNAYLGPVLQQAPNMKSLPVSSRTYDNGINDGIIGYLRDAINATMKGVSYQQALSVAADGVTQTLSKYSDQK